jgi:FkbM family methyltransferase
MQNIFLDCGFHLGEGISEFLDLGIIDESYHIYSFEPNPACMIKERTKNHPNITAIEKAVWTEDGHAFFKQENHLISRSNSPSDGVSSVDGWASSIVMDNMQNQFLERCGYIEPVRVETINFSEFVKSLPEDSNIICKMDIEGSEYAVLEHLLQTDQMRKIKKIFVEFHPHYFPPHYTVLKNDLISKIEELGIEYKDWH